MLSHFVFVNRIFFLTYRGSKVGLITDETIFVHQVGSVVGPIVNWK